MEQAVTRELKAINNATLEITVRPREPRTFSLKRRRGNLTWYEVSVNDVFAATIGVSADLSDEERLVDFAGRLQDVVIEATHQAWPRCPGHPHPASATVVTGRAVWVCPDDGRVTRRIGEPADGTL